MQYLRVCFVAAFFMPHCVTAQEGLVGKVRFVDTFDELESESDDWKFLDPKSWRRQIRNGNATLRIVTRESQYKPPVRSPLHVALIKDVPVRDFELTFRVRNSEDTGPHRDCCVFFGYQNERHFYYAHLGAKPDAASGQIMIVNDAPRAPLTKNSRLTRWTDQWHQVKVVRESSSGKIDVYFDEMDTPHMSIVDTTFGSGLVGLGSFDDTNEFDDVRLTDLPSGAAADE